MKRHLILHIGLSKTGSSSIQRILAEQRPALQEVGVFLPHSPGWANHALLPASLVNDEKSLWGFHPGTWEGLSREARLTRFRREWAEEMAALPAWAESCVITAEQIGGLLREDDEVQRLADVLHVHFDSVKVIAYLRRQDQHVASAYTQWLRGGILHEPGLPDYGPERLPEHDYGRLLDRFARAFGDAAICPRIFARDKMVGGDVVEDFFAAAGFKIAVPAEAPSKNANAGITLDGQALLLAAGRRLAAQTGNDAWRDQPAWRRLVEATGELFAGRGWRPARADAQAFLARFAETNEHARRRFFPAQDTLFDMDFSDLPEQADHSDPASVAQSAIDLAVHEAAHSANREAETAVGQYRLLKRLDDRRGMRAALTRAVKFGPDLLSARLALAEYFVEEGDLLQANEHLQAAARIDPSHPRIPKLRRRMTRGSATVPAEIV